VPLTEKGRAQARRLRESLRSWRFAAVFTSPMSRARDTCALAGYADQASVLTDLSEWDYGEDDGRTAAEIRQERPGWVLWRDGPAGGETLTAVVARADRVVDAVRAVDGDVALFSHGHLLRVFTARWLEMPGVAGQRFFLGTASPSVLGYEHDWTVVRRWNEGSEA
jgi:broad specificity phosphatase PhoE